MQVECSRERCSGANRRRRCCRRICLEIVDTWTLRESMRDESGLESLDRAISTLLGLEHPAVVDGEPPQADKIVYWTKLGEASGACIWLVG